MGSLDSPRERENGNGGCRSPGDPKIGDGGMMIVVESEAMKKRRASMLPLEVGTRVMCRWRDSKYHPVKVIERRKMPSAGPNDYEYYVHYTECIISHSFSYFLLSLSNSIAGLRVRVFKLLEIKSLLLYDFNFIIGGLGLGFCVCVCSSLFNLLVCAF